MSAPAKLTCRAVTLESLARVRSAPAKLESERSQPVKSTSAAFAHPYMSAYAASKGGIQAMTHALAAEYGKAGIRFTAVQPGSIADGLSAPFAGVHIVEASKQVYRAIPAGRERPRLIPSLEPVLVPSSTATRDKA